MGLVINNLKQIMDTEYAPGRPPDLRRVMQGDRSGRWPGDIEDVYRALGGKQTAKSLQIPRFSLYYDRFSVVLDEAADFNRYRAVALRSALYETLPGMPASRYRVFCRTMERECLKSARSAPLWTNAEAEYHFGPAMEPGDLGLNGAPGWKLRAVQGLLRDAAAVQGRIRVVYLSVWDEIMIDNRLIKLKDLLLKKDAATTTYFLKYFQRRLFQTYAA